MIDKSKTYKTRDGREVRIYATDGGETGEPVHGAYRSKDKTAWLSRRWRADGYTYADGSPSDLDIIEVRPRVQQVVWVNVYRTSDGRIYTGASHPSKEAALGIYAPNRIACLKRLIDCEEGEGL